MVFGSALVPALIRRGLLTSEGCLHPFAAADLVHEVTSPTDQTQSRYVDRAVSSLVGYQGFLTDEGPCSVDKEVSSLRPEAPGHRGRGGRCLGLCLAAK